MTRTHGDRQLEAAFGGELFGAWPGKVRPLPPDALLGKLRLTPRRGFLLRLVLAELAVGVAAWAAYGVLQRQDDVARDDRSELIAHLTEAGSLIPLAEQLPADASWPALPGGSGQQAYMLADALLFRFLDGDVRRAARVRTSAVAGASEAATVALALVSGPEERALMLPWLAALDAGNPHRAYVSGTARESSGDLRAAERDFAQAEALAPTHTHYLYVAAAFYQRAGKLEQAEAIARAMSQMDPVSPWTALALARQRIARGEGELVAPALRGMAADVTVARVIRAEAELALGWLALHLQDDDGARQHLETAMRVSGEAALAGELRSRLRNHPSAAKAGKSRRDRAGKPGRSGRFGEAPGKRVGTVRPAGRAVRLAGR